VTVRLNAAMQTSPNSGIISGIDATPAFTSPGSVSNAPGIVNDKKNNRHLNVDVGWKGFGFHARHNNNTIYDAFGVSFLLPNPGQAGYLTNQQTDYSLDHTWSWDKQQIKIGVGDQLRSYTDYYLIFPVGSIVFGTAYPNGTRMNNHYSENRKNVDLEWQRKSWANHDVLLGATFNVTKTYDTWTRTTHDINTLQPINGWQYNTGPNNWLKENITRTEKSLYGQDEWHITKGFTLTTGLRLDRFNDVGSNLSPRLAGVYNINNRHIFKAQFATAFRPPTAYEMYIRVGRNPNLKAETSKNYDLGYIYKEGYTTIRASLAYSILENLISSQNNNAVSQNQNAGKRMGVELEAQTLVLNSIRVDGNVSYQKTHDNATGGEFLDAVHWLANAHLTYQAMSNNAIHLWSQYMGKRARVAGDVREPAPSSMVWNMSLQQQNFIMDGVTLSLGVRNVFNRDVRFPAQAVFNGTVQTYRNDFPQIGRRGWLFVRYAM